MADIKEQKEKEKRLEKRISDLERMNEQTQLINTELSSNLQELVDREKKQRLKLKQIVRAIVYIFVVFVLGVGIFLASIKIFQLDKSISGLISIILTIVPHLFGPLKRFWKRFVLDCKLND